MTRVDLLGDSHTAHHLNKRRYASAGVAYICDGSSDTAVRPPFGEGVIKTRESFDTVHFAPATAPLRSVASDILFYDGTMRGSCGMCHWIEFLYPTNPPSDVSLDATMSKTADRVAGICMSSSVGTNGFRIIRKQTGTMVM